MNIKQAFWKWMMEKGYAVQKNGKHYIPPHPMDRLLTSFTSQMIIGYMIEYLAEHKIICQITTISEARNYYNILKKRIEQGVD